MKIDVKKFKEKVNSIMEKTAIIFSHNDLDGLGCILLGLLTFKRCSYRLNTYKNIDEKIIKFIEEENEKGTKSFDFLFITDISISDETVKVLNDSIYKNNWIMIDHHDTRVDLHNGANMFVIVNDEDNVPNSGTNLFKEYLENVHQMSFNQTTRIFVDMVRLWDTWLWKKEGIDTPVDIDILRTKLGNIEFIKKMYIKLRDDEFRLIDDIQYEIVNKAKDDMEYYYTNTKSIKLLDSNNHIVAYILAEDYTSLLADMFLTRNPEVHYLVILNLRRGVGSIRTQREDIHVGELAEHIIFDEERRGGGHPKASGFLINNDLYSAILTDGLSEVHNLLIGKYIA